MIVVLECRNAEVSIFVEGSVFFLRDYLEGESFKNVGMQK